MSLDKKREILQKLEELTDDIEDEFYDSFVNKLQFDLAGIVFYISSKIAEIEKNLLEQKNDDITL